MVDTTASTVNMASFVPKVDASQILNYIIIGLVCVIVLAVIGFTVWNYLKKKKYGEYKVIIFENDSSGNTHEAYDRAGIFLDKLTGFKLFFLEKRKKGLNPNNVPFVVSKDKKGRLVKTVYLKKIGISNYVFLHVKLKEDGSKMFTVGEEDVNWASQDIEKIRRTFNKENWLSKYGAWIFFAVTMIIIMIVVVSLFNKFAILKETATLLDQSNAKQEHIVEMLFNMSQTTAFNPNIPIIVGPNSGGPK